MKYVWGYDVVWGENQSETVRPFDSKKDALMDKEYWAEADAKLYKLVEVKKR